jgi:hypothetical protein
MNISPEYVQLAIDRALRHDSGIDVSVLQVPGFSTGVMRRLWNNLVAGLDTYLEVGAYFGGTACAAINNNPKLRAYIFEDGSQEFHGRPILPELHDNLHDHGGNYVVIEEDFFASALGNLPKIDCYFYDGNHAEEFQAKALPHAFDSLSDTFLFAVDDYSWESVWRGTDTGFDALGDQVEIVKAWTFRGERETEDEIWHNGVLLALCRKTGV